MLSQLVCASTTVRAFLVFTYIYVCGVVAAVVVRRLWRVWRGAGPGGRYRRLLLLLLCFLFSTQWRDFQQHIAGTSLPLRHLGPGPARWRHPPSPPSAALLFSFPTPSSCPQPLISHPSLSSEPPEFPFSLFSRRGSRVFEISATDSAV